MARSHGSARFSRSDAAPGSPVGLLAPRPAGWSSAANVLIEDDGLAHSVPVNRRRLAERVAPARVIHVAIGSWSPPSSAPEASRGYGWLLLEGFMIRSVEIGPRGAAEVLCPSDVVRPFEPDDDTTLAADATWRVIKPVRLADLDQRWMTRMSPFPEVGAELAARAVRRARRLVKLMAICQFSRLEDRIMFALWELADRCGTVTAHGVHVPMPVTHELVSLIVGARRPSVSGAIGRLAKLGLLERTRDGWVLHGEPPVLESDLDEPDDER